MSSPLLQNNPEQPTALDASAPPEGWRSLDEIPGDDETVQGLMSDGSIHEAEYWAGPDFAPDWGGWAWEGWHEPDVELIAWRPFDAASLRLVNSANGELPR